MTNRILAFAILTVTALARPAAADYDMGTSNYNYWNAIESNWIDNREREMVVDFSRPTPSGSADKTKAVSTRVKLRKVKVPTAWSAAIPADQRTKQAQVYKQLVEMYQQVAKAAGIPKDDLAGPLATYIVSAYTAYQGSDVADQAFLAVVEQVRATLASSDGFAKAKTTDKQALYEQSAFMGMYLATLARAGDAKVAASAKESGKTLLESLFQTTIDKISIDDTGYHVAK